jgi:hypothetical protein
MRFEQGAMRLDAHFENEVLLADSFLQRNKLVKIMILKTYGFLQANCQKRKTAETRKKSLHKIKREIDETMVTKNIFSLYAKSQ